jgi:hypothetical protein
MTCKFPSLNNEPSRKSTCYRQMQELTSVIIHLVALRAHSLQISPVSAIDLTWSTWKSTRYQQMLRQLSSLMQGWRICNLSGRLMMIFLVVSRLHYLQTSHCRHQWIWQEIKGACYRQMQQLSPVVSFFLGRRVCEFGRWMMMFLISCLQSR